MSGGPSTCLEIETVLAFLEGRSPEEERRTIEAHAARCALCREMLSALADTQPRSELVDPASETLAPGAKLGRYVVLSLEAKGGMGVVYAAYDPELRRKIALKLLRSDRILSKHRREFDARLMREAQALAQLAHQNVVAAYDVGRVGEEIFVAMEFVEGETLGAWLAKARRSWREVLERFLAAGRGLEAAHDAGLVHRDFKPENVLIGDDGRVRVADFGLARAVATDEPGTAASLTVTAEGTLLGTPAYMAPEQHLGEEADAASDQFSFCVALYYGLYGRRPYEGDTWPELAAAAARGEVPDPPSDAGVPRRIHRALIRGMAPARADRFPSMRALMAELERDPSRARARVAWIGGSVALAAVAAAGAVKLEGARCSGGEQRISTVWGPAERSAIEAGLLKTGAPYAAAAVVEVGRALDAYAASWLAMHRDACEATQVRGEQSEEVLDLRMTCLEQRLRSMRALGDRFRDADRDADRAVVENAVRSARELPSLDACADVAALQLHVAPPRDPVERERLAVLSGRLAEARSLLDTGRYAEGRSAAIALAVEAEAIGYRPAQAEAEQLAGALADELGDFADAEVRLERAVWAAEAARYDELAAQSWIRLLRVVGHRKAEPERARTLIPRVTAALERMGGSAEIEAGLALSIAVLDADQSRYDDAARRAKESLTLLERRFGSEDLRLTAPLRMLAWIALQRSEPKGALEPQQRALAIQKRWLSPDHPEVAATLESIAGAEYLSGDYADAEVHYREALALRERALGVEHPSVANTLHNLGLVLGFVGKNEEAVLVIQRAVALDEKALGPAHPVTLSHLESLALALHTEDRLVEAREVMARVLADEPPDHPRRSEAQHTLALIELDLGHHLEAVAAAEKSIELDREVFGADHEDPSLLRTLGSAHLRMGRADRALAPLERARALFIEREAEAGDVAWTSSLLAKALADAKRDLPRARRLAEEARRHMVGDDRMEGQLEELERTIKANKW